MACSICANPYCEQLNERLKAGDSLQVIGVSFGFAKSTVGRHARGCVRLKRTAADENRQLAKVKNALLQGDTTRAYHRALEMQKRAEESGNVRLQVQASRRVAPILQL
jgi:hypothetical protein